MRSKNASVSRFLHTAPPRLDRPLLCHYPFHLIELAPYALRMVQRELDIPGTQ
jgi:hypothetical protein